MSDLLARIRRRIDAVALTLGALGVFLSYSLFVSSGPDPDRFGGPAASIGLSPSSIRYWLFESLGFAADGFAAAWLIVAVLRLRGAGWLRLSRRAFGLAILIIGAAIILDRLPWPHHGPLTGNGGTVGAVGGIQLDRRLPGWPGIAAIALMMLAGTFLAADPIVHLLWRSTKLAIRFVALSIEWVLLRSADIFTTSAAVLRLLARPITRRLHPERLLFAELAHGALQMPSLFPAIPIHHHLDGSAIDEAAPVIPIAKRGLVSRPEAVAVPERPYDLPSLDLLDEPAPLLIENQDQKLCEVAALLEKACFDFGLTVKVVGIHTGPVITQYEISLDTGMRVSKITSLSDDLALHLRVPSVRIVAPIPGKNTVGIEVPNEQRASVRLKELVIASAAKIVKMKLPLFFGKDSEGRPLVQDLADMPHLLIAGRTGTGKSVCLNSIIISMLLTRRPDECKLIMIDPKQVELAEYGRLPHLMHPVVTDNKKAEAILSWAVDKMEERYEILRRSRVRNIASYNELSYDEILRRVKPVDDEERERVPPRMPYIVIVVDEVGDLMMAMKKEVEGHIIRLAQKSRAAGIHLILTTQRPTVDVITGLIKSNLPARICFQVADRSNSRVVLDEMGAEKLLGKGDMLFLQPNTSMIVRAQGTFASDQEILRIVSKLEVENPTYDSELLGLRDRDAVGKGGMMEMIRKRDDLYEEAIEIIIREGRGSVSLLQRALGIGYGRAARLVDYMAEDGIVGHYNGAQAREVLFTAEQWEEIKQGRSNALAESA